MSTPDPRRPLEPQRTVPGTGAHPAPTAGSPEGTTGAAPTAGSPEGTTGAAPTPGSPRIATGAESATGATSAATTTGSSAAPGAGAGTSTRAPSTAQDAFPAPYGPRTTGAGGHVLGVLIGLVLTMAALVLLTLGQSRMVAAELGGETVSADALAITLVTVGSLLAALVALLAVRTSAIPFTGGLVALFVGVAYLFAPAESHRQTVRLLATAQNRDAVLNVIGAATTGTPFLLGLVLLASGTAASLVRRRGIEVGTFRARTAAATPGDRS